MDVPGAKAHVLHTKRLQLVGYRQGDSMNAAELGYAGGIRSAEVSPRNKGGSDSSEGKVPGNPAPPAPAAWVQCAPLLKAEQWETGPPVMAGALRWAALARTPLQAGRGFSGAARQSSGRYTLCGPRYSTSARWPSGMPGPVSTLSRLMALQCAGGHGRRRQQPQHELPGGGKALHTTLPAAWGPHVDPLAPGTRPMPGLAPSP
jgi:hypothetical protein